MNAAQPLIPQDFEGVAAMTAKNSTLTQARLRMLLSYDRTTGLFRWRVGRHIGKVAGCKTSRGYWQVTVEGAIYRAHRLAWLYVKGEWPSAILDHRDGNKQNNRFKNLRLSNGSLNNANIKKHRRNKSGFKGVYKNGRWSTWVARIGMDRGKRRFLGCFRLPENAARAYDIAAKRLFGKFAITNKMMGLL